MRSPDPEPPAADHSTDTRTESTDSTSSDVVFHAVSATRSYEQVVRQIEDAIRSGQFERDQRLPTERQLAASFGVSRGVVREAIKVLGTMGLVDARQGSGLFVRNDTIPSVSRAFILSVSPDAESIERLFEFRRVLETESARLAAIHASPELIQQMSMAISEVEQCLEPLDWDTFGSSDGRFHGLLAEAAGNPYLEVAIAATREMQQDVVLLLATKAGSMQAAIAQHRLILNAVTDHDPARAAQAMAEHVDYTSTEVHARINPNRVNSEASSAKESV